MAEAAHLTSALANDKPSIFEVLAQESLISTVRPALKHAVRVLAESRPEKFGWLLQRYDEVYSTLDFLLEQYYLNKYCATFAEHFYNLKRVCPNNTSSKLPRGVFWKSLICVVLLPYIKQKLDEKFEELRHLYNTYTGSQNHSQLGGIFVTLYPYLHTTWEGVILAYQTAYMFDKMDWHSPFLHLSGVTLTPDLDGEPEGQMSNLLPWQQLSTSAKIGYVCRKLLNYTAVSVSTGLSVSVFFVQFLDWWYTHDTAATSLTSLPVPDPPQKDDVLESSEFTTCPICHRTRSNDTALSVSGYVFCYPCIYDHVKEYSMCPVTRYPARTEHHIKLYISDS